MITAPPFRYAADASSGGTNPESQVSPLRIRSVVAQPVLLCMSLHWLGVMKLKRATVPAPRSPANAVIGRWCATQNGSVPLVVQSAGGPPIRSSKKTNGSCLGA